MGRRMAGGGLRRGQEQAGRGWRLFKEAGKEGEAGAGGNGLLQPGEKEDSLQNVLDNLTVRGGGAMGPRWRAEVRSAQVVFEVD